MSLEVSNATQNRLSTTWKSSDANRKVTTKPVDLAEVTASVVRRQSVDNTFFRVERRGTIFSSAPKPVQLTPLASGSGRISVTGKPSVTGRPVTAASVANPPPASPVSAAKSKWSRAVNAISFANKSPSPQHPNLKNYVSMDTFDFGIDEDDEDEEYVPPKEKGRKISSSSQGDSPTRTARKSRFITSAEKKRRLSKRTSFIINGMRQEQDLSADVNQFLDNLTNQSRMLSSLTDFQHSLQVAQNATIKRKTRMEKNQSVLEEVFKARNFSTMSLADDQNSPASAKRPGSSNTVPSKPSSPSNRSNQSPQHPPQHPPQPRRRYAGVGINKNVPIEFNLCKMLPGALMNELQYARYEKLMAIVLNHGGRVPKFQTAKVKAEPCAFEVPPESKGISRGLYRQGDAILGWKRVHQASLEQSLEWADLTATLEMKKKMLAELLGAANRKTSIAFAESIGGDSENPLQRLNTPDFESLVNATLHRSEGELLWRDKDYIQPKDTHLAELGVYSSRNMFVGKPRLGKAKKGTEDHHIRAPPMGSGGPAGNDRKYEMSDFVVIRKVSQTSCSTIRQVVLATIPAVRRKAYSMKTTIKSRLKNRAIIESIKRERDIHQKTSCRFILGMLATFQTAKRLYTILEWCPTSLDTLMGFQRSMKEDVCRTIMSEIVVALDYLHSINIIHRGLEPANVLLDGFGHVKLSDLSTAVTISEIEKITQDTKGLRKTRYSAPELILGEKHGRAVDWFSMGTLLYEMLTGNVPFGQGNVLDTLAAQYGGNTARKRSKKTKTVATKSASEIKGSNRNESQDQTRLSGTSTRTSVAARLSVANPSSRMSFAIERPSVADPDGRQSVSFREKEMRRRSTKSEVEHQKMMDNFTNKVKQNADEEKVHFVAGIASSGKNIVQLPYLYRNITEHYNVSRPSEDIVRRLMDPDHAHRLSALRGTTDIKAHPWFRPLNISWKEIEEGKLKTSFAPGNESDDHMIADFMKNLNREETTTTATPAQTSSKAIRAAATNSSMKLKGDEDDEDVTKEDGAKEEIDPDLTETELAVLIHNTFLDW